MLEWTTVPEDYQPTLSSGVKQNYNNYKTITTMKIKFHFDNLWNYNDKIRKAVTVLDFNYYVFYRYIFEITILNFQFELNIQTKKQQQEEKKYQKKLKKNFGDYLMETLTKTSPKLKKSTKVKPKVAVKKRKTTK